MNDQKTHSHHFTHWPFADAQNTPTYCTDKVAREHFPVLQVSHDRNGDWQFLDATTDAPGECVIVCMACIYERDMSLQQIADLPLGWSAWRSEVGAAWERGENPPDDDDDCDSLDDFDRKLQQDIAQYGCQVMSIGQEGDLPPFSYSIGVHAATGAPEAVVIGLKRETAHFVVNEYNRRARAGERFTVGQQYEGFLGGHKIQIGAVDRSHYAEYFGSAARYYGHTDFAVLQIIFPNTSGVWPWDMSADEWFQSWQPILATPAN